MSTGSSDCMNDETENQDHPSLTQRIMDSVSGARQSDDEPQPGADLPEGEAPDAAEAQTGAEGGSASADTPTPFHPHKDDDSPLGSTDQHSKA
jgi:hypothetical protein